MCKSKADGGKRCEYASHRSNERRRLQYEHRNLPAYTRQQTIKEGLTAWENANPGLVQAHAPATGKYMIKPGRKDIPYVLTLALQQTTATVEGELTHAEFIARFNTQHQEAVTAIARMSKEEQAAARWYSMTGYESLNDRLRRINTTRQTLDVEEQLTQLDAALAAAQPHNKVQRLYRVVKVPAGWTAEQYMERYYQAGGAMKDPGFVSTTTDPEIAASIMESNRTYGAASFVMEILTRKGAPVQEHERPLQGYLQSWEQEQLLPRNTKLRVADVRPKQKFRFGRKRADLAQQFGRWTATNMSYWDTKKRHPFPMVQLVDEELIQHPPTMSELQLDR